MCQSWVFGLPQLKLPSQKRNQWAQKGNQWYYVLSKDSDSHPCISHSLEGHEWPSGSARYPGLAPVLSLGPGATRKGAL